MLPYHEHVDGDALATMLACAIKNYVVIDDAQADAVALWIMHTWLIDRFQVSPRLAVYSPTKGCGKTTLLSVVSKLARRPMLAISISPAAVFRCGDAAADADYRRTEKISRTDGEMHGLLNAGHGRGMTVIRVLGEQLEPREFRVFGAVAVGTLGKLPDDLHDRAIVIEMRRKLAADLVAPFREDRVENLRTLARRCARWAEDSADIVAGIDPKMPGLVNRTADNWRPLYAIAEAAGGDWPARVALAAAALTTVEDELAQIMLLTDIRMMFESEDTDRLASATIVDRLAAIEGRPWAEWRHGKPITSNQLARLLKPFCIVSGTIRTPGGTPKGYYLNSFEDAFERYFPSEAATTPQPPSNGHFGHFQNATPDDLVAFPKSQKPLPNGHCGVVAVGNWGAPVCAHCGRPGSAADPLLEVSLVGHGARLHRACIDLCSAASPADPRCALCRPAPNQRPQRPVPPVSPLAVASPRGTP